MNNHDAIIIFFIVLIIAIQAYIFFSSLRKINILKSIFPSTRHFSTVKVKIPEELINTITPEEVFYRLRETKDENLRLEDNTSLVSGQEKSGIGNGKFLYYGVPSKSGIFTFSDNSETNNLKDALYEFQFVDKELASFSIVNSKSLDFSLTRNLDIFITPVCDVFKLEENSSVVVHLNDGFVKKVDDNTWQVIEKARVKLI